MWLRAAIGVVVLLALALSVAAVFEGGAGPCEPGGAAVAGYLWLVAALVGAGAAIVYAIFGSRGCLPSVSCCGCGCADHTEVRSAMIVRLEATISRSRLLFAVLAVDRVLTAVVLVLMQSAPALQLGLLLLKQGALVSVLLLLPSAQGHGAFVAAECGRALQLALMLGFVPGSGVSDAGTLELLGWLVFAVHMVILLALVSAIAHSVCVASGVFGQPEEAAHRRKHGHGSRFASIEDKVDAKDAEAAEEKHMLSDLQADQKTATNEESPLSETEKSNSAALASTAIAGASDIGSNLSFFSSASGARSGAPAGRTLKRKSSGTPAGGFRHKFGPSRARDMGKHV